MKKIREFVQNTYLKASNKFMMRAAGVKENTERGDHLLQVLGTIIIAVVLLVFFREQLVDLFTDAIGSTVEKTNSLFNDVTVVPETPTT